MRGEGRLAGGGVALLVLIGCATYGYDGAPSDHFDGQRFHNADGRSAEMTAGESVEWIFTTHPEPWPEWVDEPPGAAPPTRLAGGHLRVTFINHATALIQMDGLNVLTDPIYSDYVGVLGVGPRRHRDPGIRFEDLPPIDVVLVSHNHFDHMDFPTLRRLAQRDHPRVIAGLGNAELLRQSGIAGGEDLDWGESTEVEPGIRVHGMPAQHASQRGLGDRNVSLWLAFVLEGPSGTVYYAGDSAFGPHYAEVRRRFGPMRLAILPIGAYQPRRFLARMHMDPAEAVAAHRALGAGESLAVHWGTFQLSEEGMHAPVRAMNEALEGDRTMYALAHGAGRDVPFVPAPTH